MRNEKYRDSLSPGLQFSIFHPIFPHSNERETDHVKCPFHAICLLSVLVRRFALTSAHIGQFNAEIFYNWNDFQLLFTKLIFSVWSLRENAVFLSVDVVDENYIIIELGCGTFDKRFKHKIEEKKSFKLELDERQLKGILHACTQREQGQRMRRMKQRANA